MEMKGYSADFKKPVNELINCGWKAVSKKNGIMLYSPNGNDTLMVHRTPSDVRAIRNFKAMVLRYSRI